MVILDGDPVARDCFCSRIATWTLEGWRSGEVAILAILRWRSKVAIQVAIQVAILAIFFLEEKQLVHFSDFFKLGFVLPREESTEFMFCINVF